MLKRIAETNAHACVAGNDKVGTCAHNKAHVA